MGRENTEVIVLFLFSVSVISSIKFDGNDGGKLYYTRNMEVEMAFPYRLEIEPEKALFIL